MDLRIYFEQIKPDYLEYIDICKIKALNDEKYYSKLMHEMNEGYIDCFIENNNNLNEDIKIHDLLEYQINLIESMNFNNDIIVKRLNKIFNILVKEKHKNDINNLNNQPSVYLLSSTNTDNSQQNDEQSEQNVEQNNSQQIDEQNDLQYINEQNNSQQNDELSEQFDKQSEQIDTSIYHYPATNQTQSKFHYRKINRKEFQSKPNNKFNQSEIEIETN